MYTLPIKHISNYIHIYTHYINMYVYIYICLHTLFFLLWDREMWLKVGSNLRPASVCYVCHHLVQYSLLYFLLPNFYVGYKQFVNSLRMGLVGIILRT